MTIKEIRLQKKITQQELADAIGVNVSVVSRYESGEVIPPQKRLEAISRALDVDCDTLSIVKSIPTDEKKQRQQAYIQAYSRLIREEPYLERIVKVAANGHCELCKQPAPFIDKDGRPYLETYFIDAADVVRELTQNMVALCPNCHQKLNVLNDSKDIEKLKEIASKHNY